MFSYLIICYASYKLTRILLAWFEDIRKKWRKSREIKAFSQALVSLFFSKIVPRLHPASRKQAGWQRLDAKSGAYHGTGIMPVIPCPCQVWQIGTNPINVTHFLTAPRPLYRAASYTFNDTLLSNSKPHPWQHLIQAQVVMSAVLNTDAERTGYRKQGGGTKCRVGDRCKGRVQTMENIKFKKFKLSEIRAVIQI